ncbi:hypothetical protein Kfla_2483 [Kribbella flavida DSM 17836]|uniref:Uncharacterized protein n=1 Tax=Kribbella flavida (strain DSM 17836 / JCM 10339 / NBRC 14399) TaxID=479435 RepID=D2PWA5_KRIFD|nr:hypothetical protein [Kribbella flavida]ADB31557.1 hypothetical protein Kfla_2483 [Kribbella flavida DSM 17836]
MRAQDLLRSIDQLPYGERVRVIVQEARRLRDSAELDQLLTELGDGPADQKAIGLRIAEVTKRADYVTRLLRDRDPSVQARALVAVGRGVPVSDDELRILHDDAPAALRPKLLQVIRRTGRRRLAARLIDEQRDRWGDRYAAALLDSTDDMTVERLLPDLAYCLSPGQWERLAGKHPEAVLAHAGRTLPTGPDRDEWWAGVGYGVTAALDHDATRVLGLIKAALPPHELPWAVTGVLGRLTDLDPSGVLAVLLVPDRAGSVQRALTPAFRRRLHRFSDAELAALGRVLWPDLAGLLGDLPPSRRATVFAAVTSRVELAQRALPGSLLDVLPVTARGENARRMLGLTAVAEDLHRRWDITSYLPYEEAFALLEPEVRRSEAEDRAVVYRAVIAAAGRSRRPEHVQEALSWAARVRNDRDPVRQAVLTAAAELPPSVLADQHVPALQTLLTDALEAGDTSWASRSALTELARRAVHQGALRNQSSLLGWGLAAHAAITQDTGMLDLYGLTDGLPHGRESEVYDALRPYLESAAERSEFQLLFAVAEAFGRRGWTNEHLHRLLEQALWSNQEYTVGTAARHWLRPTATRAERVGRIIKRDVGMTQWDAVWEAVTEHRTDLLDKVLTRPRRSRRFERNHASWSVTDAALRRWLPRQHRRYADLLADVANDSRVPDWTRSEAVLMLGRLPGIGRAALDPFLSSPDVRLQEAALRALAWTDQPQLALPVLLGHAGDDRARVALYAATRAARYVPPSTLPGLLHPVLAGQGVKVTSRKEAARLLGELRAPGASAVLAEAWVAAHRDVRAAITSAASQYLLHEPATWALLQQAVHDSAATASVLTQRTPYGLAAQYRGRYADLLIAVTNRPEPEVVRLALLSLHRWSPWNPAAAPVIAAFITDLTARDRTWNDATTALVAIVAADPERGLDEVVGVVRLLVRLESDPQVPNALADRDHPARQRLTTVVQRLTAAVGRRSAETRQALRPVADELTEPDFLHLRLKLLTSALRWSALAEDLAVLRAEVTGRPLAAATAAELVAARLSNDEAGWTPEELLSAAADLTAAGSDPAGGLLALALICAAGPRSGWNGDWRALLVAVRNHPAPDVRQRALEVLTATES